MNSNYENELYVDFYTKLKKIDETETKEYRVHACIRGNLQSIRDKYINKLINFHEKEKLIEKEIVINFIVVEGEERDFYSIGSFEGGYKDGDYHSSLYCIAEEVAKNAAKMLHENPGLI